MSAAYPDNTGEFAGADFQISLQSPGIIHVLIGTNDDNKGKVLGDVVQPQPVIETEAIYPTHTPTPTNTPLPTATPSPTPTLTPRVNAEIIGIASNPAGTAMRGEPVEIAVTVRNNGSRAMNIPVRLTFPSVDKKPERKSPRVQPGQTGVATFTWKTSNYEPGYHTLWADLLLDGNTTYGDTAAAIGLNLTPLVIAATIADVTVSQASAVVGEAVTIAVAVRNDGRVAANIPVTLHFPSDDKQAETRKPRAEPGETVVVTFTWRTSHYQPGVHTFRVAVPGDERSFTAALVAPTPTAPPAGAGGGVVGAVVAGPVAGASGDFAIAGVSWNPTAPVAGEPVSIRVEVVNRGGQAGNAPVTLHFPAADKQPEGRRPRIGAGQTESATFTWRTGRYAPGVHTFRVETPNASRTFRIALLPPTVDFVVAEIYPPSPSHPIVKGDWVELAAFVRNVGEHGGRAEISLRNLTHHQVMYRRNVSLAAGEGRVVEFTWKTLRYDVGVHELRVEAATSYDVDTSNNYSESAWAEILTHRDITLGFGGNDPLQQAAGATSKPRVRTAPEIPAAIVVLNDAPSAILEQEFAPHQENFSVNALLRRGSSSGADVQGGRMSPFLCAKQRPMAVGLQNRQEQCPGVWAWVS